MSEIREAINKLGNGKFFRVGYKTTLPLKAEFKNRGYQIIKFTEVTTRTGVSYRNIQAVINKGETSSRTITNNYEWILRNKLSFNTHTKKEYLRIAQVPEGGHRITYYAIQCPEGDISATQLTQNYKEMVQNSYWNSSYQNAVQNISLENVFKINKFLR